MQPHADTRWYSKATAKASSKFGKVADMLDEVEEAIDSPTPPLSPSVYIRAPLAFPPHTRARLSDSARAY